MMQPASSRLSIRRIDERSLGFVVAGASNVASRWMIDAIRQQAPAAGSQDVAGAWVVGVYSHNPRRARQFANDHGIIHAADELTVLVERRDVQCVYVGNHPRHHAATVHAALLAQKHVLCEPPLALDWAEADTLRQMAVNRGLVLAVNYAWRAAGAVHRSHELLVDDAIGEVLGGRIQNSAYLPPLRQGWRLQPNGGGVLLDRTLHTIDLLQALLHTSVREVYATAVRRRRAGCRGRGHRLAAHRERGHLPESTMHSCSPMRRRPSNSSVRTGACWHTIVPLATRHSCG